MASLNPLTTNLTRSQAAHLLRRATLGPTHTEISALAGQSVAAAVGALIQPISNLPNPPIDPINNESFIDREEVNGATTEQPFLLQAYTSIWWSKQLVNGTNLLVEKMVLFLSQHFTTSADKVGVAFPLYYRNSLFRVFALGNFKTLAKKICRDYAMSVYLDGWTNRIGNPNENFAREFLELYTIGKGDLIGPGNYTTYTEDDVREAARVLTGFFPSGYLSDADVPADIPIETDPDTGFYHSTIYPVFHDFFPKTFSAAFQNTIITSGSNTVTDIENELDQFINMLFNQSATAEHIVRKLYRYFVYYDITDEIENDIIQPLAQTFMSSNYELAPVLTQLFRSQHFFDADGAAASKHNIGGIIKSPMELNIGLARYLNVDFNDDSNLVDHYYRLAVMNEFSNTLNQELFEAPEVAGWAAYHQAPFYNRNWISGTAIINRYTIMVYMLFGFDVNGNQFEIDYLNFTRNSGAISDPSDPNKVVDELTNDLYPFGVDAAKREILKANLTDGDVDYYWTQEWLNYINTNDDTVVQPRLLSLYSAILQSPEFQMS